MIGRQARPGRDVTDPVFDAFVSRRYAGLVRFGYVLTGNRAGAEDLVQSALFRTYLRWSRLREPDDPTAYVRRAMVNAHISWNRRSSAHEQLLADLPEDEAGWGSEDGLERLQMWRDLATLPPRMRAVLVLRYYEDLSEAETAKVLAARSEPSRARPRGAWPGSGAP